MAFNPVVQPPTVSGFGFLHTYSTAVPSGAIYVPNNASGDIVLIVIESSNENIDNVTPTGFTLITTPPGTGTPGNTDATRLTVWWRQLTATDTNSPALGDYGDHTILHTAVIRGASLTSPIHAVATSVDASATTSAVCPSVTTTVANTLIVNIMTHTVASSSAQVSGGITNANLTSLTKNGDLAATTSNGGGIVFTSGVRATAASSGNTTFTMTTATPHAYMTIAFAPDPNAPVITSPSAVSLSENTLLVQPLTADKYVTWTVQPGLDGSAFFLAGTDLYLTNRDYETPTDIGLNNTYQILLRATAPSSLYTEQTLTVTITNIVEQGEQPAGDVIPPTITSRLQYTATPKQSFALVLNASEGVTWTKTGGSHPANFTLSGSILTLTSPSPRTSITVEVTATDAAGNVSTVLITVATTKRRRRSQGF